MTKRGGLALGKGPTRAQRKAKAKRDEATRIHAVRSIVERRDGYCALLRILGADGPIRIRRRDT